MKRNRSHMRDQDEDRNRAPSSEDQKEREGKSPDNRFTDVENAHASGLGSMGRSDEKLKEWNRSPGPDEVVY